MLNRIYISVLNVENALDKADLSDDDRKVLEDALDDLYTIMDEMLEKYEKGNS